MAIVLCLVGMLVWVLIWSSRSWHAIQTGNLPAAGQNATRALPVVTAARKLTFDQVPDLVVAHQVLWLLSHLPQTTIQLGQSLELSPGETTPTVAVVIEPTLTAWEHITQELPRTWWIKHLLPPTLTESQLEKAPSAIEVVRAVTQGPQTWLLVFQNTQELRATGGFMGSVAFVTLQDGSITNIDVQDIYQPAGQLDEYIEPPAAVAQYLAGGKGWHLTDANWSPDFPQTAQTILSMLSKSGYPPVAGVIAINLDMVEHLLELTGPVTLPDYQTTVTSHNVAEVLRSTRSDFFAGSLAKQQLLADFMTHLKHAVLTIPLQKQKDLIIEVLRQAQHKNIQIYAVNPAVQTALGQQHWAGELLPATSFKGTVSPRLMVGVVESNVGINKANQAVTRSLQLEVETQATSIDIKFSNQNQAKDRPMLSPQTQGARHLHYVNYQRLYVLPETAVTSIQYQGQPISWDEQLVTTSTGQTLKELGFLVVVEEQTTTHLKLTLHHPPLQSGDQIWLPHQSGVPTYPMVITWRQTAWPLTSDIDQVFTLP